MRKIVFILVSMLAVVATYAQDVIVKKSGEVLNVYNVEVAAKYIFYTTEQSTEDIKRILKEDVFSVKIGNGEMQMVAETVKEEPKKRELVENSVITNEGLIERKVADNNAELIARYNKRHDGYIDKKPTNKVVKDGFAILGVTKESVLSNEDIEIELRMIKNKFGEYEWFGYDKGGHSCLYYNIFIINKTDRTIYVDLGNTFRIYNSGNVKVYYDGSQVSKNSGGGSGASLNLGAVTGALGIGGVVGGLAGGVNVGGGTQSSASKTYGSQRVLAVPPMGKISLPPTYEIDGKKIKEIYDNILIRYPQEYKGIIKKYAITYFTEEETLWKNQFMITYSLDSVFKNYSMIKFGLYLSQIIGGSNVWNYKKIGEKIQDFDEYTLIGNMNMDKKIQNVLDFKYDYPKNSYY